MEATICPRSQYMHLLLATTFMFRVILSEVTFTALLETWLKVDEIHTSFWPVVKK